MRIDQLRPWPTAPEPLEIPVELLASVNRHQANLSALVVNLRAAGLDEDMIDTSVRSLVDSYASELSAAIREFIKAPSHG